MYAKEASPKSIVRWKMNMVNLENVGCHSYQVLEAPGVLNLSEDEIIIRMDILQQLAINDISIPLIGLTNKYRTGEVKSRYKIYIERTKGCVSVADFWRGVFECSEMDMDELLLSNPRLLKGEKVLDERLRKARFLFDSGIKRKDLLKASHVILNHTFDTIENRVKELKANNVHPLSISFLAQAEKQYRSALHRHLELQKSNDSRWSVLEGLLGVDQEMLKHPVYKKTPLHRLRKRIDYLLNTRGYDPEDIINCPTILQRIEVNRLEKAFHELEEAGLEDIQLATVVTYINHRRVPAYKKTSHRSVAKNLGFDTHNMADVSHGDFAGLFQQRNSVLQQNFQYLKVDCGFSSDIILDVPVILGHSHVLLVKHWDNLPAKQETLFNKWKNDQRKLLNLLQYDIEKSVNFKHSVLLSNITS